MPKVETETTLTETIEIKQEETKTQAIDFDFDHPIEKPFQRTKHKEKKTNSNFSNIFLLKNDVWQNHRLLQKRTKLFPSTLHDKLHYLKNPTLPKDNVSITLRI